MRIALLCLLAVAAFGAVAETKDNHWAVLVAGSKGFWNYRHQADICHAYQIMKNNGIPEDHIIVFSYDDVATSSNNPYPGQLFNRPDGEDVYAGCKVDYAGTDNTPENFLAVLRGEDMDGKKTMKSGKGDKVFINFSDHGSSGLIAFPTKSLYAKDFINTIEHMHENELYNEMVIYIEACYSGSMFEGLLRDDINVYATTAANSHESSWGYYCSPNDMVNGKHIGSCLGDEYSITWMEDSDAHDACQETLEEQFDAVLKGTKKSHVMEYGTKSFKNEAIGNFEGVCDATDSNIVDYLLRKMKHMTAPKKEGNPVNSRDVKMHYLYHKYLRSGDKIDAMKLQHEVEERQMVEARFEKIKLDNPHVLFQERPVISDHDCFKAVTETYVGVCGYNEYDLKFYPHFVNLCESHLTTEAAVELVSTMC
jgi:legumain